MKTININSGHVANAIDGQLVQLVKVIQVENSCEFDDALETAREFICKKHVELMDDKSKTNISEICKSIKDKVRANPSDETARQAYNALKYMGFYKLIK